MSLISFTTPLVSNGTATTGPLQIPRATAITGTVFADVAGTVFVDQGGDGINFDNTTSIPVVAGVGGSINVPVISTWFQIRYTNGATPQTAFRLFASVRDPYGAFLANALPASAGGAYVVLFYNTSLSSYQYVGRFDGQDAFGAIGNAAVVNRYGGKYAAFAVGQATVSTAVLTQGSQLTPDAF